MYEKDQIIKFFENQLNTYPLMEVRDVCKLIYQSVFGGGHMIGDSAVSLERIENEYDFMKNLNVQYGENVEFIGNGNCRIYLNCIHEGLEFNTLNRMFFLSANKKQGSVEELERYLHWFLKCCNESVDFFDYEEASRFIKNWKEKGYPAISHSECYRSNYHPAYRVVDENYGRYYKVFLEIDRLSKNKAESKTPVIIAIDGMAGSGKSTLGTLLKEIYPCNLFHVDDYFLQPHQRTPQRLKEPGGNVDYERFWEEIYKGIDGQKDFVYQKYDCSMGALHEFVNVVYQKLNIIEGVYSAHPYFKNRADLVFFMEIDREIQKERIGRRNGEVMLKRFLNEWIPMEETYFDTFGLKENGIVISGSNEMKMK